MNKPTNEQLQDAVKTIISGFDNFDREGLQDTPRRYIKFLNEFITNGNEPDFNFTTFDAEQYRDQMITVLDIPFHSLCEHHLAPFMGVAHVAYIPKDKIVGLSKIPRTVDFFARKFQNQERITTQIADYLTKMLSPQGVIVVLKAKHMCVEMRGIKKHNCQTVTSAVTGLFKNNATTKQEFLGLINNK